ncbi:MAG: hypothetical protein EOO81_01365 [Oxalobacteraceae bacterium]|nr:MAG: hypothetical protein EOO81_01365 [Oxalobacteraceae bacterium]
MNGPIRAIEPDRGAVCLAGQREWRRIRPHHAPLCDPWKPSSAFLMPGIDATRYFLGVATAMHLEITEQPNIPLCSYIPPQSSTRCPEASVSPQARKVEA